MKISYEWLKEFVKINASAQELAEQLSLSGLEVDSVSHDHVYDVQLTPNRGDCLSAQGLAREISAINSIAFNAHQHAAPKATSKKTLPIKVALEKACPRYTARVIENIDNTLKTPDAIKKRLQQSGINSISLVVDVMNYVMIETGQPLHAFDLSKIDGEIDVRHAKHGEKLVLLDDREVELDINTLIIADKKNPLAIAGIMGGLDSGVTENTTDILIESAFFAPEVIHGRARYYGLQTDAAHRFERGVDPELPIKALDRATELLLSISSGNAGPIIKAEAEKYLPKNHSVKLTSDHVTRLLGVKIPDSEIKNILERLGMDVKGKAGAWEVTAPSYRFDIQLAEDLIEEVARVYGYTKIPATAPYLLMTLPNEEQQHLTADKYSNVLADRGYQEVITYSFVDPMMQTLCEPHLKPLDLVNPIASDLSVMRTSLWPGLLSVLQYNINRQQNRFRCFEAGVCFLPHKNELLQQPRLAGVVMGSLSKEQWKNKADSDFYTIKADIETLLALTHKADEFTFIKGEHSALHPGKTAAVVDKHKKVVGYLGAFHPRVLQALDIKTPVYGFELILSALQWAALPQYKPLSVFPSVRRDIAVIVKADLLSSTIEEVVRAAAGEQLIDFTVFDVYQGKGVPDDAKSIAMGLTLQHSQRTLTDAEVEACVQRVISALEQKCSALLRK